MEKEILNLVKNIYSYAFKKDGKYYSPVSFSRTEGSIPLLSKKDVETVKSFVTNVLSKNIFTADSKADFIKAIEWEVEPPVGMTFDDFIKNETEIDNYLRDSEGYKEYTKREHIYIILDTVDGIKCLPLSRVKAELEAELLNSFFLNNRDDSSFVDDTIIQQNDNLFRLIANELLEIID